MADLSKIKLNGTEYDLKDSAARPFIINVEGEVANAMVADKTFEEVQNAMNRSQPIILYRKRSMESYNEKQYPYYLIAATKDKIVFEYSSFSQTGESKLKSLSYLIYKSDGTFEYISGTPLSLTVRLPLQKGTEGQILVANSFGTGLVWQDYPDIPTLEPVANVEAMLTSFGLNAAANLAPAQAGTAEVGKAVVQ